MELYGMHVFKRTTIKSMWDLLNRSASRCILYRSGCKESATRVIGKAIKRRTRKKAKTIGIIRKASRFF